MISDVLGKNAPRKSVYLDGVHPGVRAKYLLEYSKKFDELWSHVPYGEARYARLRDVVAECAEPKNPVSLFYYYDCIGPTTQLSKPCLGAGDHQVCCVCGGRNGSGVWSEYFDVLSRVAKAMEDEYGHVWAFDMCNHSDVHYFYFGFDDKSTEASRIEDDWVDPDLTGCDVKFLCDCGQYGGVGELRSLCPWAIGGDGNPAPGVVFNDKSPTGCCQDVVSLGGGRSFVNYGSIGNTLSEDFSGRGRPWVARPRTIDELACREFPPAGSVEEFALRRAAEGGLVPGDWFEMSQSGPSPLWDGEKWIDYVWEKPILAAASAPAGNGKDLKK